MAHPGEKCSIPLKKHLVRPLNYRAVCTFCFLYRKPLGDWACYLQHSGDFFMVIPRG